MHMFHENLPRSLQRKVHLFTQRTYPLNCLATALVTGNHLDGGRICNQSIPWFSSTPPTESMHGEEATILHDMYIKEHDVCIIFILFGMIIST